MNWYIDAWKNYVVFDGRARRAAYWYFMLINLVVAMALGLIDGALGLGEAGEGGLFSGLYALAAFLPGLALTVRRLHDTERSGWWVLIGLIPLIGTLVLLYFMVCRGTAGPNRYGIDPLSLPEPG